MKQPPTAKAFTLVEIMIVITIIVILSGIGLFMMNSQQETKNQAVKNRVDVLEQQVKSYNLKNGTYPESVTIPDNQYP